MKTFKLFKFWIFLIAISAQAQEVKNQSEIIRNNVSKGEYRIVADLYKSHSGVMEITDVQFDKNQPNDHFEIVLKQYPNHATESTRNETSQYFPDNIAFPVTYVNSVYEGNKKLQEKVGYVVREGRSVGRDRIVFIDDYMFFLQKWESKDDYEIRFVLKAPKIKKETTESEPGKKKKKKKKGGFLKSIKSKMRSSKSIGGSVDIDKVKTEVLQPYLDEATKKQETYYKQWIANSENAKTKKYIDDKRAMMDKAMKQYNDDIFNSPEYQRMLAYQKWLKNNVNVTVANKKGSTIWVGSSKEAFITHEIPSGGQSTQTCTTDLYYYYSDAKGSPGHKFYSADSNCGRTVTIN
ncbi:hypothetical protein [Winogradskyella marincola]|uniref:Uncharacterized protein n=1 Tax=Winogradskyella marincola TaxID=3037795 RepID=A0ABT6FYB0_9FLAO|nr:hypothetical protein [Winogradskyella sp. YYF002]MDG4714677.1 hypothetical protein [Winogradskyella sp. YYF002]